MLQDFSLEGKSVIVVGSTYGIGADTALYLAGLGADVLVTGRSEDKGQAVVDAIKADNGSARFLRTDVGVESDVKAMIAAAVDRNGRLDAIVNNAIASDVASTGGEARLAEQTNDGFEGLIRVGIWGLFWSVKYALKQMETQGSGSIINIASFAGVRGVPGLSTYSMTKGAMLALTRNVAVDYGKRGIRINSVVVGTVPVSEVARFLAEHPTSGPAYLEGACLPRIGEGRDISRAVAFLAADASTWMTGTDLTVDGGFTVKAPMPDQSDQLAEYFAQLQPA